MSKQQNQTLRAHQITCEMQRGLAAIRVETPVPVQITLPLAVREVFDGVHDHFEDVDAIVADGYGEVRRSGCLAAAETSAGHLQRAHGESI